MKKSFPPIIFLLLFAFVGCSNSDTYYPEEEAVYEAKNAADETYLDKSSEEANISSS